jgi:hypothetical protein
MDDGYRADVLEPVPAGVPDDVQILTGRGEESWPAPVAARFEEQVLREWPLGRIYGAVHSSVSVWLRYPLVTARVGGRVLVPVVDGRELSVEGLVDLPARETRRRVVVLVDASASANRLTPFAAADGTVEHIPVIEAERRALDHLVDMLDTEWLEVGIVAFGETTQAVAEPGMPVSALRQRLDRFRRERPRGEGRTDTVCALWTAYEWLRETPPEVEPEIILLTDGEMPHSGRFVDCGGPYMRQSSSAQQACEARRNTSDCPARPELGQGGGTSDLVQLARFSRRVRGEMRITPLIFEPDRGARAYEQLARRAGSRAVRVPSPQAIDVALPALVSSRIRGVFFHNLSTGVATDDVFSRDTGRIGGQLALAEGANDIELRIHSDRGLAGLFRFRVYAQPGHLRRYLAVLRESNDALEARAAQQHGSPQQRGRLRSLKLEPAAAVNTE